MIVFSFRTFALPKKPFHMFRFDPPNTHIDDAVSGNVPVFDQEILIDPTRRLAYELRFPIDCPTSDLDALYAALSSAAPMDELLQFADRLWPLARANFVAHVISRRPADASWLYALLESHVSIDTNAIYALLTEARAAAEIPAPSRASLNEALDELFSAHCEAAFVGFDNIENADQPVLRCMEQILARDQRHLVRALGGLLGSYQNFIDPLQKDAARQIASRCLSLQQQPDDAALIQALAQAVNVWLSTNRPLLIWSTYQGRRELDFDTPIDELRGLIAHLSQSGHHDVAIKISEFTRDLFSSVPTTLDQLVEDARVIDHLALHAAVGHLRGKINELEREPGLLITALERDGFGRTSSEPARGLWDVFVRAAKTKDRQLAETAWKLIRDFAIRLSDRPQAAEAVVRLITGLIEYGETVSAAPHSLNALRNNLSFMKSFIALEPVETGNASQVAIREKPENSRRSLRIGLAVAAVFASAACGAALYFNFDNVLLYWPKSFADVLTPSALLTSKGETMPPVGTGQHLTIDGVRYCHFQQERLRTIKQAVQGPEDTRAYNLLIVDYNSRCSDYFFRDDDVKIVLAELASRRKLLESEANEMMSAWPGRGSKDLSAESTR